MPRFQLSMRGLIVLVAICGLLCMPLERLVSQRIDARDGARCSANLVAIGNAMHQYEAKYGHFPPAHVPDATGKPARSWRVLLLEFLDPALFNEYDFDEPWDGPHNLQLASKMSRVYGCPGHRDPAKTWVSSYAVIVGRESAFPEIRLVKVADITDWALSIPPIMIAEAASLDILWTEPRDLRVDQFEPGSECGGIGGTGISGEHPNGAALLCFNGQIRRVKPTLRLNLLSEMITIAGSESFGCENYR
jgi:hypothetical protein